jgi:hypothetical protein
VSHISTYKHILTILLTVTFLSPANLTPNLLTQLMTPRNMRSGGWIEQIEVEINAQCDDRSALVHSKVKELCTFTKQMGLASGRDLYISKSMKELMEQTGFVNVQERKLKLPLGSWATDPKLKDVGRFYERFYKTGLQGWLLQICTRTLNVSAQISDRRT